MAHVHLLQTILYPRYHHLEQKVVTWEHVYMLYMRDMGPSNDVGHIDHS